MYITLLGCNLFLIQHWLLSDSGSAFKNHACESMAKECSYCYETLEYLREASDFLSHFSVLDTAWFILPARVLEILQAMAALLPYFPMVVCQQSLYNDSSKTEGNTREVTC